MLLTLIMPVVRGIPYKDKKEMGVCCTLERLKGGFDTP